ncbi:hypothetical protein Hanom_Chr01g00043681 [Helianthus anomalus]
MIEDFAYVELTTTLVHGTWARVSYMLLFVFSSWIMEWGTTPCLGGMTLCLSSDLLFWSWGEAWRVDMMSFSERMENYTLFFLLNLDFQWRREKRRDIETAGEGRIPLFQLQKVCLRNVPCPNNEVTTSLYRRHMQP